MLRRLLSEGIDSNYVPAPAERIVDTLSNAVYIGDGTSTVGDLARNSQEVVFECFWDAVPAEANFVWADGTAIYYPDLSDPDLGWVTYYKNPNYSIGFLGETVDEVEMTQVIQIAGPEGASYHVQWNCTLAANEDHAADDIANPAVFADLNMCHRVDSTSILANAEYTVLDDTVDGPAFETWIASIGNSGHRICGINETVTLAEIYNQISLNFNVTEVTDVTIESTALHLRVVRL